MLDQDIVCKDTFFKRIIANNTIWEEPVVMAIVDYAKPNTQILDIGANIGLTALCVNFFLRATGKKNVRIQCFEPSHEIYMPLSINIKQKEINNNITFLNVGLSDEEGVCDMALNEYNLGASEMLDKDKDYNENYRCEEDCYFVRLDSMTFDNISVIKIDVEGHELNVLLGAENTIGEHRPIIIIEIFPDKMKEVEALLNVYDYYRTEQLDMNNYVFKPYFSDPTLL